MALPEVGKDGGSPCPKNESTHITGSEPESGNCINRRLLGKGVGGVLETVQSKEVCEEEENTCC